MRHTIPEELVCYNAVSNKIVLAPYALEETGIQGWYIGNYFSAVAKRRSQSYTQHTPGGEGISFLTLTLANILRFPWKVETTSVDDSLQNALRISNEITVEEDIDSNQLQEGLPSFFVSNHWAME